MALRLPLQALEPPHLLPGPAHGARGGERHLRLPPARRTRELRAQLVSRESPQPDGQAGRLPGEPHRARQGQALPRHAAAQRAGLPHDHPRRPAQRQRHLPLRGHLPAPQHADLREPTSGAHCERESPGAPHGESQPPTQTHGPGSGAGRGRHKRAGGCPAVAAADLGAGCGLPQGHSRCLCLRERGRASEGGPLCGTRVHRGLRRAGFSVAREDARAPRPLRPRADRVCHDRLPQQAGLPGAPASEARGRTLPLAPLTGLLGWPASFGASARSPGGPFPGGACRGEAVGTASLALLSPLTRPGGRRCPRPVWPCGGGEGTRGLSRPIAPQICCSAPPHTPPCGGWSGAAALPDPPMPPRGAPGHGRTGSLVGDCAGEVPPRPRDAAHGWRGTRMGPGTSCPSRPGKELLVWGRAGRPWATLMHSPAHQTAWGQGGNKGNGPQLGSRPPLGAHAWCYLWGPPPGTPRAHCHGGGAVVPRRQGLS